MKKSIYSILAVAALFAACAENDTFKDVDNQEVAIDFDGKYVNKVTRAEVTETWLNTSGNKFGVFGYKGDLQIFNNEEVTSTGSDWTHNTKRFWDKSATNYKFYAYAPYTSTAPTFSTTTGFTFTSSAVITNITTDGADKAIALNAPTSYAQCCNTHDSHVQFTFNHVFSKLSFKAKVSTAADALATIVIKSIKLEFPTATAPTWAQTAIGDVAGTTSFGTYTEIDADASTYTYGTEVYNNSSNTTALTTSATAIGNTFIVVPVNADQSVNVPEHVFGVEVTYDLTYKSDSKQETNCKAYGIIGGGNDATHQFKPEQNDYYVVTITVDPAQIEFCIEGVNAWDTETGNDVNVK